MSKSLAMAAILQEMVMGHLLGFLSQHFGRALAETYTPEALFEVLECEAGDILQDAITANDHFAAGQWYALAHYARSLENIFPGKEQGDAGTL